MPSSSSVRSNSSRNSTGIERIALAITALSKTIPMNVAILMTNERISLPADRNNPPKEQYGTQRTGGAFASAMPTITAIRDYAVADLIARIGEDTPSPGCGVAAAVTFALAAACAAKAAVISHRHQPDDHRLNQAYEFFLSCARVAMSSAEADRREFTRQLEEHDPGASLRLADAESSLIETIDKFEAVLAVVAPLIRSNLAGDLFAAQAMAAAARQVEENNLRANTPANATPGTTAEPPTP